MARSHPLLRAALKAPAVSATVELSVTFTSYQNATQHFPTTNDNSGPEQSVLRQAESPVSRWPLAKPASIRYPLTQVRVDRRLRKNRQNDYEHSRLYRPRPVSIWRPAYVYELRILRAQWMLRVKIGSTVPFEMFQSSPQAHAILNQTILKYFQSQARAQRTTPYAIPPEQVPLLRPLGMELPPVGAPEAPHALHKSIEELQLSLMANWLPSGQYGLVSCKDAKVSLLPPAASVQNPIHEAKDVARYPGSAITHASFTDHQTYFLHDVASVVGPHELVERLVASNPTAHLFVTGVNPAEVLTGHRTYFPNSHKIDFEGPDFTWIPHFSTQSAYTQPAEVTVSWLRSSSIMGSNGQTYHVTLLDEKLGHCIWHIFAGKTGPQDMRAFSTGNYVRVPAAYTGTLQDEFVNRKLLTGMLDFWSKAVNRKETNLAIKATQIATALGSPVSAREREVVVRIVRSVDPEGFWNRISRGLYLTAAFFTLHWTPVFSSLRDIHHYLDEHKTSHVIHPTPGGGWTRPRTTQHPTGAIPNNPTLLEQLSAFTSMVMSWGLPKIAIGQALTSLLFHVDYWHGLSKLWEAFEITPARAALTCAVVYLTAALPTYVARVLYRTSGHFYRLLWLPVSAAGLFHRVVVEVTGGPGYTFLRASPGRGWAWQALLWSLLAHEVVPGLAGPAFAPLFFMMVGNIPTFTTGVIVGTILSGLALAATAADYAAYHYADATPGYYWFYVHGFRRAPLAWLTLNATTAIHNGLVRLRTAAYWACSVYSRRVDPNAPQPFAALQQVRVPAPQMVRVRHHMMPVPALQLAAPVQLPNVNNALAVRPLGQTFPDWLQQVTQAYQAQPNRYPQLTPNQACFWDCLAHLGGTAHMWYSWYHAMFDVQPAALQAPFGPVDSVEIAKFASASGIGYTLNGMLIANVAPGNNGYPTINMKVSKRPQGTMHVEIAQAPEEPANISALARILRTIQLVDAQWFAALLNAHILAPLDSHVRRTPFYEGVLGDKPQVTSYVEIGRAFAAVAFVPAIAPPAPNAPAEFGWDFVRYPLGGPAQLPAAGGPALFTYHAAQQRDMIADSRPTYAEAAKKTYVPPHNRKPADKARYVNRRTKIGTKGAAASTGNRTTQPARWWELRKELAENVKDFAGLALPAVQLSEEEVRYTADVERAARLTADLKANPGVLDRPDAHAICSALDAIIDHARQTSQTVTCTVSAYLGVFGSGKTTALTAHLNRLTPEQRLTTRIVAHTEKLRAELRTKLDYPEFRGYNIPSLLSAIAEPTTGIIAFDDAGKVWGGVLDLVILANPGLERVIVNGDPAQGRAKFPVPGSRSEYDPSAVHVIAEVATRYATVSHRAPGILASLLGVHTTNATRGHLTHCTGPKPDLPVVTASPRYVQVLSSAGREAYTYDSAQGLDFNRDVEVDMTGLEGAVSDSTGLVAITRSKTGVFLHGEAFDPTSIVLKEPTGSPLINALVYELRSGNSPTLCSDSGLVKAVFYRHLRNCMPRSPWFAGVGFTPDPQDFILHLPTSELPELEEPRLEEPSLDEPASQNLPPEDPVIADLDLPAKEYRERPTAKGMTDQFTELGLVNPPRHKRSDDATYMLGVQQRLTPVRPGDNAARFAKASRLDMIEEYDRLVPNPPILTAEKLAHYTDLAIKEYCSRRSERPVFAKLAAHDPTRTGRDIKISMKGQTIKKTEKKGKPAVPPQLIHEFDIHQTLGDAPYFLFVEHEILPSFPEFIQFFMKVNPAEFIARVRPLIHTGRGVHAADAGRWDTGCGVDVLHFDRHVFQKSQMPQAWIDGYVDRRLNARSQHGEMATMQNSGDRGTKPMNDLRNAVICSYMFECGPGDTLLINGDDSWLDRSAEARPVHNTKWTFKHLDSDAEEFSGFTIDTTGHFTYSASGLLYRIHILEEFGVVDHNRWEAYLDLFSLVDSEDRECVDILVALQRHLPNDLILSKVHPNLYEFALSRMV